MAPQCPPSRRPARTALALGWALAASSLAACAAPPYRPAVEAPAPHTRANVLALGPSPRTSEPAPNVAPEPAPAPSPGGGVSLDALLLWADRHSPLLVVARATRSRAEAARVAAGVLLPANPQVTASAGPRFGISGTGVDAEASLTQQVQIAGERGTRLEAARRLGELTDAEIEQMRWAVHSEAHAGFHRVLVARERARLAEQVVAFQTEVLGVVERQARAGALAPFTARLAQAEVAQARQSLVAARQDEAAALIRLAVVAGWPAGAPPELRGALDPPQDPPSLDQLVAAAERHTPVLRLREAAVREAEARVALADRAAWPQPSVGVQYRHEGNPTSEGPYDIVMGTLTVPLPVFQRNQGDRARSRSDVDVARAELAAARVQLAGQLAEARAVMAAAAQRTRAYGTEILPRFEENLTLLRRSFEVGQIDVLELLVGRERFLRIQSDALAAQLDYFVSLAALERLVGIELWEDDHHEGEPP
ncbi:MAG: TolC family protein [Polyangiales bacterium]